MDEYMIRHKRLAAEVERLCGMLFERWCERRSVIPLAFLMCHWPIVSPSTPSFRGLSSSLRQLVDSGVDSLDLDDQRLILSIVGITNNLA